MHLYALDLKGGPNTISVFITVILTPPTTKELAKSNMKH